MNKELLTLAALAKGFASLRQQIAALTRDPGPQGIQGPPGPPGPQGLRGLPGADGKDGRDGADGVDGADGADGAPGVDGKDGAPGAGGPIGPMPRHEWRGTELRFQQSPNVWGKWVDLKGPRGSAGASGGGGGGYAPQPGFDVDSIEETSAVTPGDFMVLVRGGALFKVAVRLGGTGPIPANAVTVDGMVVTVNGEYVISG